MTMRDDRLRDGNDFAARLLEAGLGDAPRPAARARIAAGLAVGSLTQVSAATSATGGAAAQSATGTGGAASAGTGSLGVLTTASVIKSFAVGAVVGAASLGAASTLSEQAVSSSNQRAPLNGTPAGAASPRLDLRQPAALRRAEAPTAGQTGLNRAEPPALSVDERLQPVAREPSTERRARRSVVVPRRALTEPHPAPAAAAAVSAFPSSTPRPAEPAPDRSSLSVTEEVTILDRARSALAAGQANQALSLLGQHQSQMKVLQVEAQVLRIEALGRAGHRAEARALGDAFVRTYPNTAHAARVRELLDE